MGWLITALLLTNAVAWPIVAVAIRAAAHARDMERRAIDTLARWETRAIEAEAMIDRMEIEQRQLVDAERDFMTTIDKLTAERDDAERRARRREAAKREPATEVAQ